MAWKWNSEGGGPKGKRKDRQFYYGRDIERKRFIKFICCPSHYPEWFWVVYNNQWWEAEDWPLKWRLGARIKICPGLQSSGNIPEVMPSYSLWSGAVTEWENVM